MRVKVLWLEDEARFSLRFLPAYIYMQGKYDLFISENVTDGLNTLHKNIFDVVIVDIRLLPGSDSYWIGLYQRSGQNRISARLGLRLLKEFFSPAKTPSSPIKCPNWLTPDKVAVFTVEGEIEIQNELNALGITVYTQKTASLPQEILSILIERVLAHRQIHLKDKSSH